MTDEKHFELLRQWKGKPYDKNNAEEYIVDGQLTEWFAVRSFGSSKAYILLCRTGECQARFNCQSIVNLN
jgi:hypothetical protein